MWPTAQTVGKSRRASVSHGSGDREFSVPVSGLSPPYGAWIVRLSLSHGLRRGPHCAAAAAAGDDVGELGLALTTLGPTIPNCESPENWKLETGNSKLETRNSKFRIPSPEIPSSRVPSRPSSFLVNLPINRWGARPGRRAILTHIVYRQIKARS